MKIGIDIRNIGKKRTGDEVVFFNLVKNLAQIESQNEYHLFTDIIKEVELSEIKKSLNIADKKNFKVIPLKCPNKFVWNAWTLPQYLKKNPVDVYHTQYIVPFFVSQKIKIITTIHDVSFNAFPELIEKIDLFFLKTLLKRSLKRSAKIIAVSQFTKDEIIKYYGIAPEKIEVAYNAIGDESKKPVSEEKIKTIKEKYHLQDKFILYLGTLQPRKNISMLIEAYQRIIDDEKDLKLVICGNRNAHNADPDIEEVMNEFDLADRIIFPGFIPEEDKTAVFRLATIFCSPSLYEGFSLTLLEAMAAEVPVVASDIPAHREIAKDVPIYINPKDPNDLSKKLILAAENKKMRDDAIAKGCERIKNFSWPDTARKMSDMYQKAIGVKP